MSTDLPPEAFTRETLQEAFNWLQNQPDAIRSNVHTPERLVSLYQKSQRLNDQDAPVSSKKFITDLKNLATSLDQFNSGGPNTLVSPTAQVTTKPQPLASSQAPKATVAAPIFTPQTAPVQTKVTQTTQKASFEVTTESHESPSTFDELDSSTQSRIRKVKERFNLGSDSDAIRVLVALGFEKFSQIQ